MKPIHFQPPDFRLPSFQEAAEIRLLPCKRDGIAPQGFYLTSHLPTFYKVGNEWQLPKHNSLNCVAVLQKGEVHIVELRDLKAGDLVVCYDPLKPASEQGIHLAPYCFGQEVYQNGGRAVESSLSQNYDDLIHLMQEERARGGHILWVLGPSVVFDHDSRIALVELAKAGYIQSLLAGNAMATHDLEGGYLGTALGQNIYTQESVPMGHYNHLDLLNAVRHAGSTKAFIEQGYVRDGFMKTLVEEDIPFVLAGSVRDDGPLPEVYHKVTDSLTAMKTFTDRASLIICMATLLHSVATANLASAYHVSDKGELRPVFLYVVDITENVANKVVAARENFACRSMITNVQDFLVNLKRALIEGGQA